MSIIFTPAPKIAATARCEPAVSAHRDMPAWSSSTSTTPRCSGHDASGSAGANERAGSISVIAGASRASMRSQDLARAGQSRSAWPRQHAHPGIPHRCSDQPEAARHLPRLDSAPLDRVKERNGDEKAPTHLTNRRTAVQLAGGAGKAQSRQVAGQFQPKVPKLANFMDAAETDVPAHMTHPKKHLAKLRSTNPGGRTNR